jgi:hypothetical protein
MLLADSAQAVGGKLFIMGGGWSQTGPAPAPSAIALKFDIPWDDANRPHQVVLELLDGDGRAVLLPGPVSPQPIKIITTLEVGRPPGLTPGTPLDASFAVNVGPLPLQPGRYEWRCTVEDVGLHEFCAFSVRSAPPQVSINT